MAVEINKALTEVFNARNIAAFYDTMQEDVEPYLGETLFPPRKIVGLDIKYVKGKAGAPVVLRPAAFDTSAPIRTRIPFQTITNEMAFWRESMVLGERERQDLMKAVAQADPFMDAMLANIYNDAFHLMLGANAAVERMRMKLLSTGTIQFTADGVPYDYAYGFDQAKQSITLTDGNAWDQSDTADPLTDIDTAMRKAKMSSARVLITADTFRKICACKSVRLAMYPQPPGVLPPPVPPTHVLAYFATNWRITFVIIEEEPNTFRERVGGADMKMFPDGVATLIPADGVMGDSFYGTTPEEADLMLSGVTNVQIVGAGIAVATYVTPVAPIQLSTTVSQIALPSCERIDRMYIINAY